MGAIYSTCRPHNCSWYHAELVESYRLAVEAQNLRAEDASIGYQTELYEYFTITERRITFKDWLIGYGRRR